MDKKELQNKIDNISETIKQLKEAQEKLQEQFDNEEIEYLKKLDWLKECDLTLDYFNYQFRLAINNCPKHIKEGLSLIKRTPIQAMISKGHGVVYLSAGVCPYLFTYNSEVLIDFLKNIEFKSLEYDTNYLALLETARSLVNQKGLVPSSGLKMQEIFRKCYEELL